MYMYYPLRDKDRKLSDCFVNALFMAASSVLIRLYDRLLFLILYTCMQAYTIALEVRKNNKSSYTGYIIYYTVTRNFEIDQIFRKKFNKLFRKTHYTFKKYYLYPSDLFVYVISPFFPSFNTSFNISYINFITFFKHFIAMTLIISI